MSEDDLLEECRRFGVLDIVEQVMAETRLPAEIILGHGRSRTVVAARRTLCIRLRELGMSYPEIGLCIGRDHTTVMNLVKTAGWGIEDDGQRPKCLRCRGLYEDHMAREPHPYPARGCDGYVGKLRVA